MQDSAFLVLSKSGILKLRKSKPDLSSGERGVRIKVSMPDAYFDQPFPEVNVEFDENDVIEPSVDVRVQEMREQLKDRFLRRLSSLDDEQVQSFVRRVEVESDDGLVALVEECLTSIENGRPQIVEDHWSVEDFAEALELIDRDL